MVNFYIPGLNFKLFKTFLNVAEYMKIRPEYVHEDSCIKAFYGCFANSIWNGGRINSNEPLPVDQMQTAISLINGLGIAVRYTFTNSLIKKEHLLDENCNRQMILANNGKNEVLVNSDMLETFLRDVYPNFKYCKSTTACLKSVDEINAATEKYDMVVIDYTINKDLELLDKIRDKKKIEILVDEICPKDCPLRGEHYRRISEANINHTVLPGCLRNLETPANLYKVLDINKDSDLTYEDIYNTYVKMGFENFKLVGRGSNPVLVFESLIYYLIKPEYRDTARQDLLPQFIIDVNQAK